MKVFEAIRMFLTVVFWFLAFVFGVALVGESGRVVYDVLNSIQSTPEITQQRILELLAYFALTYFFTEGADAIGSRLK